MARLVLNDRWAGLYGSAAGDSRAEGENLFVGEASVGSFGLLEYPVDGIFRGFDASAFQPEDHIRFSAHRTDLDNLFQTEVLRRHSGVDRVGQFRIAFFEGLDDRRRMHSGRGPESVIAQHGIIAGYGNSGSPGNRWAVFLQAGKVLVRPRRNAHQLQIDQHLVDLRVSHALADSQRGSMDTIGAGRQRSQGIGHREAAVRVAVPVHAYFLAQGRDYLVDYKTDQCADPGRGRVAHRVADRDGTCATADRRGIQPFHGFRIATRRVFGYVHHAKSQRTSVGDGLFRGLEQEVVGPVFRVTPYGAGTDEAGDIDGKAYALRNLRHRTNVVFMGAGRAVGFDLHFGAYDLAGQGFHVRHRPGTGPGKSEIGAVDAQVFHQVQDFDFLADGGIFDGRRLQAVAKGFVIQYRPTAGTQRSSGNRVPVVNKVGMPGFHQNQDSAKIVTLKELAAKIRPCAF